MGTDLLLVLAFLAFAAGVLWTIRRFKRSVDVVAAGVLLFAVPFYCSPVLFKQFSGLAAFDNEDVVEAVLLHVVYCATAIVFMLSASMQRTVKVPLHFHVLGKIFAHHNLSIGIVCGFGVLADSLLRITTVYQMGSVELFVESTQVGGFGILGAVSDILLAGLAVSAAIAFRRRRFVCGIILLCVVGTISIVNLSSVQRTSVVLPVFMLVAALLLYGQRRLAIRLTAVGAVGLLVLSPVLVLIREANAVERTLTADATVVADVFSEKAVSVAVASIVQRADLIQNTIVLKEHIDQTDFVGPQYYWSVITVPIPRAVYPDKPIALSADGTLESEISVLAWQLSKSGVGSLTAFGGITAYRQGGWVALILDAICLGLVLSFLARWLGDGDPIGRMFFVLILMSVTVKRAPASLMELCVIVQSLWPFVFIIWALNLLCEGLTQKRPLSRKLITRMSTPDDHQAKH